jgi:hypothetical protein
VRKKKEKGILDKKGREEEEKK